MGEVAGWCVSVAGRGREPVKGEVAGWCGRQAGPHDVNVLVTVAELWDRVDTNRRSGLGASMNQTVHKFLMMRLNRNAENWLRLVSSI
jgi:hypothetical protein